MGKSTINLKLVKTAAPLIRIETTPVFRIDFMDWLLANKYKPKILKSKTERTETLFARTPFGDVPEGGIILTYRGGVKVIYGIQKYRQRI